MAMARVTACSAALRRANRHRPSLVAGALLLAVALGLAAGPAATPARASCASPIPVADAMSLADVVLVGTVTHAENSGRWVDVRVEERWRGAASLPDVIRVHGGPEAGSATTIDRAFAEGRYLFFLTDGPGPEYYVDNACTATTTWTDDLAQYRPGGVVPAPAVAVDSPPGAQDGVDLVPVMALVAALVIALVAYFLILRARGRPPDWMR
jgi:hypothetical protein